MTKPCALGRAKRRARLMRYGSFAAVWIVLIGVSREFVPRTSGASTPPVGQELGALRGRDYLVRIRSATDGPRYDVRSLDGRLLRAELRADELASEFPMLDAGSMTATPEPLNGRALMLADPED